MSFRGTRFYEELAVRNNAIARLFPQAFRNSKNDVSSFPPPESSNKNDLLFKVKAYEQPDSLKNWRLETMLSQDCSLDCQGIRKWRVQRPITQVQKHYDLLLKMKLGHRPSFERTSPMLSQLDLLLKLLGRRPIFKRTSPMLRHPSPETIMISY